MQGFWLIEYDAETSTIDVGLNRPVKGKPGVDYSLQDLPLVDLDHPKLKPLLLAILKASRNTLEIVLRNVTRVDLQEVSTPVSKISFRLCQDMSLRAFVTMIGELWQMDYNLPAYDGNPVKFEVYAAAMCDILGAMLQQRQFHTM